MKLKDRIAIVTGGASGIGAAISRTFAKEGATVIIVNKNNPKNGIEVVKQIIQDGGIAQAIVCDITNQDEVINLIKQVIHQYNRIDILVNNAGKLIFKDLEETTLDEWDLVLNTNLKGAFLLSQNVIPYMKNNRHGKIIFVSSVAAIRGIASASVYSASKGGMLAMARSMVAEFAQYGININVITPGATATPMNEKLRSDPYFMEQIKLTPSGCRFLQAADIAHSAVFLCSDDSNHIHGLDLIIDGGVAAVQ